MKTSESLMGFYKTYLAWIEAGAPDGEPFFRNQGLCSNLYDYAGMNPYDTIVWGNMLDEMHNQFDYKGLNHFLPFNENWDDYTKEYSAEVCFLNADRVNWVRDRVEEEEQNVE